MPNIRSQEKRDRQNLKRAERNKSLKSRIKTTGKNFAESVAQKNPQKAQEDLESYFMALDKAVKTKTVHKNFAANNKSKASKLFNSMKAGA